MWSYFMEFMHMVRILAIFPTIWRNNPFFVVIYASSIFAHNFCSHILVKPHHLVYVMHVSVKSHHFFSSMSSALECFHRRLNMGTAG